MTNTTPNEDENGQRGQHLHHCTDCNGVIYHNHANPDNPHKITRCISCNFRRKRIRGLGLIPGWEGSAEYERLLDEMMKGGGPHIDKNDNVTPSTPKH